MPILSEQVEENLLLRMLANQLFIQLHTESRPLRQRKISIYHFRVSGSRGLHPILGEVVEMLENLEVRRGCREVEGRRRRDRPSYIMRRDQEIVRLGPGRQLLRFEEAAEMGNVWLDDVGGL